MRGGFEETCVENVSDRFAISAQGIRLAPAGEQLALEALDDFAADRKQLFQKPDVVGERKPHCLIAVMAFSRHYLRTHRRVDVPASFYCPYYWSDSFAFLQRAAVCANHRGRVLRDEDPSRAGAAVLFLSQLEDGSPERGSRPRYQGRAAQRRSVRAGAGARQPR